MNSSASSVISSQASVDFGPIILPFESHALAVEGDEPAVGDSDPVSVARQVGEHSVGSTKNPLGIDSIPNAPFGITAAQGPAALSLKQPGSACLSAS